MRLDFNVLWFDDQSETIDDVMGILGPMLLEDGFRLVVRRVTDFSDPVVVTETIREAAHHWDVDLVMLDFELGQGNGYKGGDLAVTIRSRFDHKDILFYSGHGAGIPALRETLYTHEIDGAYLATRDQLHERAYEIIQNLIKKVVDLDHMRGIIMAETSDLDDMISDSLVTAHTQLDDDGKASICKYIVCELKISHGRNLRKVEGLGEGGDLDDLLALHPTVFSSALRRRALVRVIKALGWHKDQTLAPKHNLLERYTEQVSNPRDLLAHAKVVTVAGVKVLRGKNGVELSDDDMVSLRGTVLLHRENVSGISVVLGIDRPPGQEVD